MRRNEHVQIMRPALIISGLLFAVLLLAFLAIDSYLGANGVGLHGWVVPGGVRNLLPESYFDTCRQISTAVRYVSGAIWLLVIIPSIIYGCIKRRKKS